MLDLEGVDFVDSQGSAKLSDIHALTEAEGVTLRLARLKPHVVTAPEADGVLEVIGAGTYTATFIARSKRN